MANVEIPTQNPRKEKTPGQPKKRLSPTVTRAAAGESVSYLGNVIEDYPPARMVTASTNDETTMQTSPDLLLPS